MFFCTIALFPKKTEIWVPGPQLELLFQHYPQQSLLTFLTFYNFYFLGNNTISIVTQIAIPRQSREPKSENSISENSNRRHRLTHCKLHYSITKVMLPPKLMHYYPPFIKFLPSKVK